jgi:hypothetical protein
MRKVEGSNPFKGDHFISGCSALIRREPCHWTNRRWYTVVELNNRLQVHNLTFFR